MRDVEVRPDPDNKLIFHPCFTFWCKLELRPWGLGLSSCRATWPFLHAFGWVELSDGDLAGRPYWEAGSCTSERNHWQSLNAAGGKEQYLYALEECLFFMSVFSFCFFPSSYFLSVISIVLRLPGRHPHSQFQKSLQQLSFQTVKAANSNSSLWAQRVCACVCEEILLLFQASKTSPKNKSHCQFSHAWYFFFPSQLILRERRGETVTLQATANKIVYIY